MIALYRLSSFLVLSFLISGMQCTSYDSNLSNSSKSEEEITEHHQAGFARDTILVHRYQKMANAFLYQDAQKAMNYAKQVLRISQKHQWGKGKILAYNLLSTYYLLDGSYDILRELSNETITLSQKRRLPFYTGHAKRFIADTYSEYRQWDSAQMNYGKALKIFTEIGDDSSRAICLENLASSHRDRNNFPEAIKNYNEAYQLFDKIDYNSGKATVLQSIGYLHARKKNYNKSNEYYLKALPLYLEDSNFYGELSLLNDLGNSYYWDKQYDKAIEMCLKALKNSKKYHSLQQSNWALQTLSRAYRAKNMYKEAMVYGDEYYYNRRMLHDDGIRRQYTMYQLMYDNQQMDTAIQGKFIDEQRRIQQFLVGILVLIVAFSAFLWFNNKKLRRKNTAIKEALIQGQTIERKRVAAELHDHLGGTLASLNWYLYGIDKTALSDEEKKIYDSVHQMVGAAYKEVRSLSHNLMPAELEEHGLIVALNRLVGKLNENKSIDFVFTDNGLDKRYRNKIEIELYSIVLELTNNIIKHSGANQAEITLNENSKNLLLTITDNGLGINNTANHGVGLTNVKNRVMSLSGNIKILEEPEQGTRIEIEIPIALPH